MLVISTNGNKYIITFVGDYTRMCFVYLLKDESQAFETFKNFHIWNRNELQWCIGSLHTGNGGEYTSNDFESYLRQHGIRNQTKIPYNP